jgi:hypothetical protein
MPVTRENLHQILCPEPPDPEAVSRMNIVRESTEEFIATILANVPVCGDQQAAIRLAREAGWTAEWAIQLKGAV